MKPQRIVSLNDVLSDEEKKQLASHDLNDAGTTEDWVFLAEWVELTGLDGYRAYQNDKVEFHEMLMLIAGKRVLEARRMYENAQTSFVGAVSAQTKNPHNTFKRLTKEIVSKTKAEP